MIKLAVNGQNLAFKPGTNLRVEWTSPFVSNNGIPGVITYPFWVSIEGYNSIVLGYPQRPAAAISVKKSIGGAVLSIGQFKYSGILVITNGNERFIEVTFLGEQGVFNEAAGKSLREFEYGGSYSILPATVAGIKAHMLAAAGGTVDTFNWVWAPMIFGPFDIVNMFDANSGVFDDTAFQNITPFPYLLFVLRCIFEESGYRIHGSFIKDEEIKSLCIFTMLGESYASFAASPSFSIAQLLPDIKVSDFLNDLVTTFNLAIYFEPGTKNVYFEQFDKLYSNDYIDWTSIVAPGRYQNYSFDEGSTGYKFIQVKDITDKQEPTFNTEYSVGESPFEDISTGIIPTSVSTYAVPGFGYSWITPEVQPDNSSVGWFENYTPPIRLFFYRGMQAASSGNYPLITPFDKDFSGSTITGAKYSMLWEGDNGLYQRGYKSHFAVKQFGRKTNLLCQPNTVSLEQFSFFRKIRVANVEYAPLKLTFTASESKISQALLEAYAIR